MPLHFGHRPEAQSPETRNVQQSSWMRASSMPLFGLSGSIRRRSFGDEAHAAGKRVAGYAFQ
jgi:hypothetical protein